MSPTWTLGVWNNTVNSTVSTTTEDDLDKFMELYDYQGALLFVVGLLCVYGLAILFLIISLIRKSRTELELVDHLRDFEAMRRASKRRIREQLSQREHSPSPDMLLRAVSIDSHGSTAPLPSMRRNPAILRLMRAQTAVDIPEDSAVSTPENVSPCTPRSILRNQTSLTSSTSTPPRSPPVQGEIQFSKFPELTSHRTSALRLNGGFVHDEYRAKSIDSDSSSLLMHSRQASRDSYLMPISETAQLNLDEDDIYTSPPIYV